MMDSNVGRLEMEDEITVMADVEVPDDRWMATWTAAMEIVSLEAMTIEIIDEQFDSIRIQVRKLLSSMTIAPGVKWIPATRNES